ncbi:MAG: hypothetical protein HJJLKODD_01278 [Phycisphaerae bacterium]|nr:hypothetical protein [Phycisphaerae bacterium]
MCYFLCLGLSEPPARPTEHFAAPLELHPADGTPIAAATLPKAAIGGSFLVTLQGCSCDLMQGGHRQAGRPELLLAALTSLLQHIPSVCLLKHWFTLPVAESTVTAEREKILSLRQFAKMYPAVDEDVRYVISG